MATSKKTKWHHRLFGTATARRRVRDVLLRHVGLTRTHMPMQLVREPELVAPNIVKGLAAETLLSEGSLYFIQVGVFDGQSEDDLTTIAKLPGVRGVLVEPQSEPFAKLKSRFGASRGISLLQAAIAPNEGTRTFYSTGAEGSRLASFDRDNLLRHGVAAGDIRSSEVRCLPLESVLAEAEFPRLDVLQIDAEGYDLEVLATLDLERWCPTVLRIEYRQLPPKEVDDLISRLAEWDYRFLVQDRDLVAIRAT